MLRSRNLALPAGMAMAVASVTALVMAAPASAAPSGLARIAQAGGGRRQRRFPARCTSR